MELGKLKKLLNSFAPLIFFVLGIFVAKEMNTSFSTTSNSVSLSLGSAKTVILPAVAVTPKGEGVVTKIKITAIPNGRNKILMSVVPFSEPDTQQSFYNAILAAYKVTNATKKYDWLIEVESNTTLIGGPSAGLVVAIGASSILLNRPVRKDCAFTGEVTKDGRVLPVGAVYEKAMAVLKAGYRCFIIPQANEIVYYYTPKKECKTIPLPFGVYTRCYTYLIKKELNLTEYFKQFNLTIIPVSTLKEALKYALK